MRNPGILVGFKVQRHGTAAFQKFSVPPLSWGVGRFRLVCVRGFFGGIELEMEEKKNRRKLHLWTLCCYTNGSGGARHHGRKINPEKSLILLGWWRCGGMAAGRVGMEGLWEGQARETSEPLPAPKGTPGELFQVSPNPSCPRVVVQRESRGREASLIFF